MKTKLLAYLSAGLLFGAASARAASITVTGGGTNGESIFVTIDQDFTIAAKPGESFGGYYLGFSFTGVLDGAASTATGYQGNWYNLPNTVATDAIYQSSVTDPGTVLVESCISLSGTTLAVYYGTPGWDEFLVSGGASLTFKAGTIELEPSLGNVVLQNPGTTYQIAESNLFSITEQHPSLNTSNVMIVPEPSALVMSAAGLLGLAFRRNRR